MHVTRALRIKVSDAHTDDNNDADNAYDDYGGVLLVMLMKTTAMTMEMINSVDYEYDDDDADDDFNYDDEDIFDSAH